MKRAMRYQYIAIFSKEVLQYRQKNTAIATENVIHCGKNLNSSWIPKDFMYHLKDNSYFAGIQNYILAFMVILYSYHGIDKVDGSVSCKQLKFT